MDMDRERDDDQQREMDGDIDVYREIIEGTISLNEDANIHVFC